MKLNFHRPWMEDACDCLVPVFHRILSSSIDRVTIVRILCYNYFGLKSFLFFPCTSFIVKCSGKIIKSKFSLRNVCITFTVWPDLAKFRHLGKLSKILGKILWVYILSCKILNLFWPYFIKIGQIWAPASSQIMANNLAIWSHW